MATQLRIGFDLRRMHKTGIGRYARNLFSAMAAEAPQHVYVAVVQEAADAEWARSVAPDALCVVSPARQYSAREIFGTPALPQPVDVFHTPHPYHIPTRRAGGQGRVITLLDLIQMSHPVGARGRLARAPLGAVISASCRRADRYVAISRTTRGAFHERLGVPLELIHVTPLAPDPGFATGVDPNEIGAARARWGVRGRIIACVGTAHPHKNLDRLVEAFAIASRGQGGEPLELVLAGPVSDRRRTELTGRARRLRVDDHVHVLGTIRERDLLTLLHAAQALVLPSLVEGFGLTLLEAMQCGTPCVASDIPVLREVAGDAALFANPLDAGALAQAITAVVEDASRAAELRARGFANLARYDWRVTARETLEAYAAAANAS